MDEAADEKHYLQNIQKVVFILSVQRTKGLTWPTKTGFVACVPTNADQDDVQRKAHSLGVEHVMLWLCFRARQFVILIVVICGLMSGGFDRL